MDWRIKRNATLLLFDTGDAWTGSCIFIRVASFRLSMRITSYCLTFWPLTAVLLFAFVQRHCALVACYSKWVIVAFYSAFLFSFFFWCVCVCIYLHQSQRCTYSAVWLLHGWFHVKLDKLHCQLRTISCRFLQSHIRRAHACNLPQALAAERPGYFYVLLRWHGGWTNTEIENRKLTQTKILPPPCPTRTTSQALQVLYYPRSPVG